MFIKVRNEHNCIVYVNKEHISTIVDRGKLGAILGILGFEEPFEVKDPASDILGQIKGRKAEKVKKTASAKAEI